MDKKLIEVQIEEFDLDNLSGLSFSEAAKLFESYPEKLSLSFTDFKLRFVMSYDYCALEIHGKRLETDSEYSHRIKQEEQDRTKEAKKLERERTQYEKLKLKFENE